MRNIFGIAALAAAAIWISKMLGAKQMSDASVIRIQRPRLGKASLSGLSVIVDVAVDNPTNKSVVFTTPVVTLSTQGQYLASTVPDRRSFRIEPLSQSKIDAIGLIIPWSVLAKYAGTVITRLQKAQPEDGLTLDVLAIPLEVRYTTYLNGILYESQPEKIL
jgi:hypothetical protein